MTEPHFELLQGEEDRVVQLSETMIVKEPSTARYDIIEVVAEDGAKMRTMTVRIRLPLQLTRLSLQNFASARQKGAFRIEQR